MTEFSEFARAPGGDSFESDVVIAGASGFIGQAVASLLVNHGVRLCEVDRSHGIDIRKPETLSTVSVKVGSRLAYLIQSPRFRDGPDGFADVVATNTLGLVHFLEWARANGADRVVVTSSASVYQPSSRPIEPGTRPAPESVYAASKYASELLAKPFRHDFSICVVRPYTVYGPGQSEGLIARTLRQILSGRSVSLAGGVGPLLSPLYVRDFARVLVRLLGAENLPDWSVLDIPGPDVVTLRDIADCAWQILGSEQEVAIADGDTQGYAAVWNPAQTLSDVLKGVEPQTRLIDGLRATLDELKDAASKRGLV